jgi:hypothetical protein
VGEDGASRTYRAEIRIDSGPGHGRSAGRAVGRLVVGHDKLIIRSALARWIPPRSASKEAVGDITVVEQVRIGLPALRWRRLEIVRFTDPASPFYGVSVMLSRGDQIFEELRARGYAIRDTGGA